MKDRLRTVAFPILLACLLTPLLVFAGDETNDGGVKVREQNGISYINGGVAEQKDAVNQMRDFNLKLTMAAAGGKFSAAPLKIDDGKGRTLIDILDAGPLFLAKMPPGTYTIHVLPEGEKPMTRTVTVASKGQEQVTFTIPDHSANPSGAGDVTD